jgi:hypothetical protein
MPLFFAITPVRCVYGDHCVWVIGSGLADVEVDAAAGATASTALAKHREANAEAEAVALALAVGRIVGKARMRDCIFRIYTRCGRF